MSNETATPTITQRLTCAIRGRVAIALYAVLCIIHAVLLLVDALSYIVGSLTFGRAVHLDWAVRVTSSRLYLAMIGFVLGRI